MLQLTNVYFKFGDDPLFEELSFTVHAGHRVGIVGRNGAGKTTLFELIQGTLAPHEGNVELPVAWRIASLRQHVEPTERSAIEFVMDGDIRLRRVQVAIERAEKEKNDEGLAEALTEFEDLDGYRYENRAATILVGLGFTASEFSKPYREFSGGWRIRLNLAQALMTPAELMLLDEPTNHLDLEATVWLQRWLSRFDGTVLMIAHDRDFLDGAVDTIVHIDQYQAKTYRGGYSSFEEQRATQLAQQEVLHERQIRERQRIGRFIDRFRYKATKARQVQSRIKLLERMQEVAIVRTELPYRFSFQSPTRLDQPMVQIDNCCLGYGGIQVIGDFTQRIYPGDRIGVLGLNGAGKSTLLKSLASELAPIEGSIQLSEHTSVGYFAQHQLEVLDGHQSARDHVAHLVEMTEQQIRNFLGAWGFGGNDIFRSVEQFSGGEKARLVLAMISLERPALLVLDEPTNHLDIDMRSALAYALDSFEGAVVVVAHDQHLLRQCVNEFWLIDGGRVSAFEGDLEDYEESLDRIVEEPKKSTTRSSKEVRKERAELRNRQRNLVRRREEVEGLLAKLEQELRDLNDLLVNPETFQRADRDELNDWMRQHGAKKKKIDELENEWMSIEERLYGG